MKEGCKHVPLQKKRSFLSIRIRDVNMRKVTNDYRGPITRGWAIGVIKSIPKVLEDAEALLKDARTVEDKKIAALFCDCLINKQKCQKWADRLIKLLQIRNREEAFSYFYRYRGNGGLSTDIGIWFINYYSPKKKKKNIT